jgi:ATP-dependent protease HslVU (ClpYQ) peptidase subunit
MSVIACRIFERGYEIGADSISVRGYTQSKGSNDKLSKLVEINGIVIGGVGFAEENALLSIFASTRRPERPTQSGILEYFAEFSQWKKCRTEKAAIENSFLIGFEGKIFHITGWMIAEVKTFEAIGAGMDYALAALYLGHTVEEAIKVAIELSIYCEAPINVIKKPG